MVMRRRRARACPPPPPPCPSCAAQSSHSASPTPLPLDTLTGAASATFATAARWCAFSTAIEAASYARAWWRSCSPPAFSLCCPYTLHPPLMLMRCAYRDSSLVPIPALAYRDSSLVPIPALPLHCFSGWASLHSVRATAQRPPAHFETTIFVASKELGGCASCRCKQVEEQGRAGGQAQQRVTVSGGSRRGEGARAGGHARAQTEQQGVGQGSAG